MGIRAGYKQTEAGIIPEDWEVKQLQDISIYRNGKSYEDKVDNAGDYYLITLDSLDIKGKLKPNHKKISRVDTPLSKNDLIMILSDVAHGYFLGLTDLIPENEKYILNQRVGVLKAMSDISPQFLSYFINHRQNYFKTTGQGSSQQNLSKGDIEKLPVPVPALAEQEAIAAALSDADALIAALEELIAKKRQIKQGAMQELLTGKRRLPGFEKKTGYRETEMGLIPNDWDVVPIASLLEKGTRITYGVVQPGENVDSGVLFIRGGDIYAGKISVENLRKISHSISNSYKRTILQGGEILISLVGYPGEAAIVPDSLAGANIARQAALIRLNKDKAVSVEYVCFFLLSNMGKRLLLNETFGSAQQVINLKDINKLVVVLPREKNEQTAITEILSDMDAEIDMLEAKLAKSRQVKVGMMQELLTGKVRLV
jgi:type I restriction enzyme, S subunit